MPEFLVEYRVTGNVTEIVKADSLAEAEAIVEKKFDADPDEWPEFLYDLEEVTDADSSVRQLFSIERADGTKARTTYVRPTDKVLG